MEEVQYDTLLVYDIRLQAFTKHKVEPLAGNSPFVVGAVDTGGITNIVQEETVTDGGVTVTAGGEDVTISVATPDVSPTQLKYITMLDTAGTTEWTFSLFNNGTFADWVKESESGNGQPYDSYIETAYFIGNNPTKKKFTPYVVTYLGMTETGFTGNATSGYEFTNPGGGTLQVKFNWTDSAASNKWSRVHNIYRMSRHWAVNPNALDFDTGQTMVVNKTRIRGSGDAFQMRFQSEDFKDMNLIGYHVLANQTTNI